ARRDLDGVDRACDARPERDDAFDERVEVEGRAAGRTDHDGRHRRVRSRRGTDVGEETGFEAELPVVVADGFGRHLASNRVSVEAPVSSTQSPFRLTANASAGIRRTRSAGASTDRPGCSRPTDTEPPRCASQTAPADPAAAPVTGPWSRTGGPTAAPERSSCTTDPAPSEIAHTRDPDTTNDSGAGSIPLLRNSTCRLGASTVTT